MKISKLETKCLLNISEYENEAISQAYKAILNSNLFDETYYIKNINGLRKVEDAALDYLYFGWLEGRDPSPFFSGKNYLFSNPDVLIAGTNPLVHYELFGRQEARLISGTFESKFSSMFGGLWIDSVGFKEEVNDRFSSGELTHDQFENLVFFERNGFVIFRNAIPSRLIDELEKEMEHAFALGNKNVICQLQTELTYKPLSAGINRRGTRLIDAFTSMPGILELLSNSNISEFLKLIFEEKPLLMQSLSFDVGSEQGLHQDTAYVVVNKPLSLAACWIALEDVNPGSGELIYMPGSHRFPDFNFGAKRKHWNRDVDGENIHECYLKWLYEEGTRRGLEVKSFLPHKGDVLIWHADLAHGSHPITDSKLSRKSLVGHFCPSQSCHPDHFEFMPKRSIIKSYKEIDYCSRHFDI